MKFGKYLEKQVSSEGGMCWEQHGAATLPLSSWHSALPGRPTEGCVQSRRQQPLRGAHLPGGSGGVLSISTRNPQPPRSRRETAAAIRK
jgi:hypothetical protein